MELKHEASVPRDVESVWAVLTDIETVARCFPGAEVTAVDGDSFTGTCRVKLGPISLRYSGQGTVVDSDPKAHRLVLSVKGRDARGNGTAQADISIELASAGDGTSQLSSVTNLDLTGRPAQFGRGLLQEVSDKLLQQFIGELERAADEPTSRPSTGSPHRGAEAESTPRVADGGEAIDLAAVLLTPAVRQGLWACAGVVVGFALGRRSRRRAVRRLQPCDGV